MLKKESYSRDNDLLYLENPNVRIELQGRGRSLSCCFPAGKTAMHFSATDLYTLELTSPMGKKRVIGSAEAEAVSADRQISPAGQTLNLTLTHRPDQTSPAALIVHCHIFLANVGDESEWRINVENKSGYALQKIKYPCVVLEKRFPQNGFPPFHYPYDLNADYRSALLLGIFDGMLIPEPHESIPDGFGWAEEHPGRSTVQMEAYYDGEGGLCLYTKDGTGCPKLLGFERSGTTLEISPTHLFPRQFGADVAPEYAVVLAPFSGDWQMAAQIYKRWALTQDWTKLRLTERQDIPAWLRAALPIFLYVQMRPGTADHTPDWEKTIPHHMLPVLREMEKKFNSPLVALIFGWEKHCSWITPDVFPPYPNAEEFKALVDKLHEGGSRVFLYNSGTRWAVKNPRDPQWDGLSDWEAKGRQASCVGEDGKWSYDSRPWAVNHKLCIAAGGTQEMMDGYVEGFASLGIDATQYDQNLGGETYVCYEGAHGHPPGYGRWMYDAAKKMLKRFLEGSRQSNPDFAISVEGPNEVLIPYLTFYDSRSMVYHGWPLLTNMPCLGVPLFSYLYHEYALGFAGDYHIFLTGQEADPIKIGRIVSSGHLLCDFLHIEDFQHPAPDLRPAMRLFINASRAIQTYAYDFHVLGKMCPTPRIEVKESFDLTKAQVQSYYDDSRVDYVYPDKAGVKVPAVFASAWLSPDGTPGVVLVNMSETAQSVEVELNSLGDEWRSKRAGNQLVLENLEGSFRLDTPGEAAAMLSLQLPPLQVSVLKPISH